MEKLFEPIRKAIVEADPEAGDVSAFATVWITPKDRGLGFVICADDHLDRRLLAHRLREHADALEASVAVDLLGDTRSVTP